MKLFISPADKGPKITEVSAFKEMLRRRWANVVIQDITDVNRCFILEWEIPHNSGYLHGKLDRSEDMMVIEFSSIELAATFAIWAFGSLAYRENIVLYDDSYSAVVPLGGDTTPLAIVEAFA